MSVAYDLLAEAQCFGLTIHAEGNQLKLKAPTAPPADLLDRLRTNKPVILAALAAGEPTIGDFEERAAIVEYGAKVPRAWAEGFARLDGARAPGDVPPRRWRQFVDDCGLFLDAGWADKAAALGWGPLDLFGADRRAPSARVDRTGLLWLLNGDRLLALTGDRAVIETRSGIRQTYYRRDRRTDEAALAWDLKERTTDGEGRPDE